MLSPTTTAIDRGEKRLVYLAMPSLRHLLLVDVEAGNVEHLWRAGADDPWFFELGVAGATLHLSCPAMDLSVDEVLAER